MKKFISILTAWMLTLTCISGSLMEVFAEDTPLLALADITANIGEIIEMPVTVSNNAGVVSLVFDVDYDNTKLTLLNVTDENLFGDAAATFSSDIAKVPYVMAWDSAAHENI